MKSLDSSRGVYIILAALLLVVFLSMCALGVGLAMLVYDRIVAQQIADSASLGALSKWVSSSQDPDLTYNQKAELALTRANEFLTKNKIIGLEDPENGIGQLYIDSGPRTDRAGQLILGQMVMRDDGNHPCGSSSANYPCFKANQSGIGNPKMNAVQVVLKTRASNLIVAPFAFVFGNAAFQVEATSTATMVERCSAFLLDVSLSVVGDTHNFLEQSLIPFGAGPPSLLVTNPSVPGLFAYRDSSVASGSWSCNDNLNPTTMAPWTPNNFYERLFWCNTRVARGSPNAYPWNGTQPPGAPLPTAPNPAADPDYYGQFHFRDDYYSHPSRYGLVRVDSYVDDYYIGPQPLTIFLMAFNAALRTIQAQQTPYDMGMIKVFTGDLIDEVPPVYTFTDTYPRPSPYPLTNDLGYLIQITNANNRGTYTGDNHQTVVNTRVQPNFINHGWFPQKNGNALSGGTNLVRALDLAIYQLENFCSPGSKKQILVATDAISTCTYQTHQLSNGEYYRPNVQLPQQLADCGSDYESVYRLSEKQLLGESPTRAGDSVHGVGAGLLQYPSILERLISSEISLSVLTTGNYIGPNVKSIVDCTPANIPDPPMYLDYIKAMGLGFTGFGLGAVPGGQGGCSYLNSAFVESSPVCEDGVSPCTDKVAFDHVEESDYAFRRANALMAELTLKSNGLYCPLLEPDIASNYYDSGPRIGQLKDGARTPNTPISHSLYNLSKSESAAACAQSAFLYNPFMLAEPAHQE